MRRSLSAPNGVVWDYFLSLRLLEQGARQATSPELVRQQTALALIMSVTVVEVFLNLWFRVRVEERSEPAHRLSLKKDLRDRKSLESKLKTWPKRYLGHELDMMSGPGKRFAEVKRKRNAIVHFTTTHEDIDIADVRLRGMADTTEYDLLTMDDATSALRAALELIAEIFTLAGLAEDELKNAMHAWTGAI
jgi:hypothetical protein